MQKSKKKNKKKKFFMGRFSGDKKGGKSKCFFFFFRKGRGKCEINYKKKKIFFLSFRKLFHYFWSLVCRKR